LTARDRLDAAIVRWNATRTFHFLLQLEGRSVPLDEMGLLTYDRVEGDVVAPDRLQAEAMVRTPVGNTPVAYIAVGDRQWLTNPLTRQWEPAPAAAVGGGVGGMFDPDTGIGAMLADMEAPEIRGEDSIAGEASVRLGGSLPGVLLAGFAADLAAVDRLDVELSIGTADDRIRRIVVREPPYDATAATWRFDLSRFDEPISIEPPL
jgi:hypothetical protein